MRSDTGYFQRPGSLVTSQYSLQCHNATVPLVTSHLLRLYAQLSHSSTPVPKGTHSPSSASLVPPLQPSRQRLTTATGTRRERASSTKQVLPPAPPPNMPKFAAGTFQTPTLSRTRVERLASNERSLGPSSQQANARPSARHVMQRCSPISGPCGSARFRPIFPLTKPKLGPGPVICAA